MSDPGEGEEPGIGCGPALPAPMFACVRFPTWSSHRDKLASGGGRLRIFAGLGIGSEGARMSAGLPMRARRRRSTSRST